MKKISYVVSVLAFFSNFALADDNKFDGPYAGIHIGYDTSYANGTGYDVDGATGYTSSNYSLGSTVFGGFVGFNKVLTNNVLVGIEADYEFQNADKTSIELFDGVPDDENFKVKNKAGDAASIRGKLGYVFNENRTLAYLTAGYAFKKLTNTYIDTEEDLTSTSSNWYKGWTVGAGGEHFVYDNLALKAEFRYTDDDNQVDSVPIYDSVYKVNFQPNKSVRIGVAYHF